MQEFRRRGHNLFLHADCSRIHNVFAQDGHVEDARRLLEIADGTTIGVNKNGGPDCDAALFLSDHDIFDRQWVLELHRYLKSNNMHDSRGWDNAAGVIELFQNGGYVENATNGNHAAAVLGRRLREFQQFCRIEIKYEVQTNAVFVDIDNSILDELAKTWRFSQDLPGADARFICSWKTKIDDVHDLADDIRDQLINRLRACDRSTDRDRTA